MDDQKSILEELRGRREELNASSRGIQEELSALSARNRNILGELDRVEKALAAIDDDSSSSNWDFD